MAIKVYKPTINSRRNMSVTDYSVLSKVEPEKSLLAPLNKKSGRNSYGRITVRHRGGGNRRKYRIIDFKRQKFDVEGTVKTLEYDPNRSAFIALVEYTDGEKAYIIGVGCKGKLNVEKLRQMGIKGIESISGAELTDDCEELQISTIYGDKTVPYKDAMLERCHVCKGKEHMIYDEIIGESKDTKDADRFAEVEKIEKMSPEERFAFFQKELSKCIRCNACRNACPACSCRKCVFDSTKFDSAQKANVDSFEEKMFHIIRAFHVAGRCTDCGECSRVCPQGIPLHLFNRKFIKDIDTFYGEYQAGADAESKGPLTSFTFEDVEPSIVAERG